MPTKMTPFIILLSTLLVAGLNYKSCDARDTITAGNPLRDGDFLVSAGEQFELGIFSPEGNTGNRYVGIWYYKMAPQTVVWVANRDTPLPDNARAAELAIDKTGNLILNDAAISTELSLTSSNNSAKLLDSGNLVLIDGKSGETVWESFEHPTDTFLPGMKMKDKLQLTSWISPSDPRTGDYTFEQVSDKSDLYILRKGTEDDSRAIWRSREPGNIFRTSDMPPSITEFLAANESRQFEYNQTRLLVNSSGQIQLYRFDIGTGWSLRWSEPKDNCSVYNLCGDFSISCSRYSGKLCNCLTGFQPVDVDYTRGCAARSKPCSDTKEPDIFLDLMLETVGGRYSSLPLTEAACRKECIKNCECRAYTFIESMKRTDDNSSPANAGCLIWTEPLKNIQGRHMGQGRKVSVRVAVSDIRSTKRDCGPCGASWIPYPLSTGPSCGDPNYNNFHCNNLTGQLEFKITNGSYPVLEITKEKLSFVIEVKGKDDGSCEATAKDIMSLMQSMPYSATSFCSKDTFGLSSINLTHQIEVGWKPPQEPSCKAQADCGVWPNSSCREASGERRCFCLQNYQWSGSDTRCEAVHLGSTSAMESKEDSSAINNRVVLITTSVIAATLVLCSLGFYFFYRSKISAERTDGSETMVAANEPRSMEFIDDNSKEGIDVPFFKLESIIAATENFSDANKLGEGGFGNVYRAKFPGGQEIAVKRLSSLSGQGIREFRNEVILIAKLQHRNLVRLLGYCIERNEKILLYEYMPNKSLDTFIFDKKLSVLLDWKKRFDIILGIARGLLYLHQDSRLRIIHRDLKTSNILLDEEMNPKISDFGLARIVEGKETEASTNRIVGTYGYMPPEYALEGFFSIKSDVFSFGVIVLEIVSGKRNIGLYQSKESLNLLGCVWNLWQESRALEILDDALIESFNSNEVLKSINIGLLCVQEDHEDRPAMTNVISMLGSETATVPIPKRPAFSTRKSIPSTSSSSSSKPGWSYNEMTMSMQQGR